MNKTKIFFTVFFLVFCVSMIHVSELHRQVLALDKRNREIVEEHEKESTTEEIKEPTRYEIASMVYEIDPYLLEAIERLETGHYKSPVFLNLNNSYGGRYNGEYLSYDSHLQSTMELARLLRFSYYNNGITDLNEIGKIYCPDDETWATKVKEIYNGLK